MNYLIIIILGIIIGLAISRARHHKIWDITMGALGALSVNALISVMGAAYNLFAFLLVITGTVAVIHFGRLLEKFPQN